MRKPEAKRLVRQDCGNHTPQLRDSYFTVTGSSWEVLIFRNRCEYKVRYIKTFRDKSTMTASQEYAVGCITRYHTGHADWIRPYSLHQESCVEDLLQLLHQ